MNTLERQLADYGDRQRELHGPLTPDELIALRSLVALSDTTAGSAQSEITMIDEAVFDVGQLAESGAPSPQNGRAVEQRGDDLTVSIFPEPGENAVQHQPRRWIGMAAVAVTILVVVGAFLVANRDDLGSQPSVADPVTSPSAADPIASPGAADPVRYQWSRVPHDETVFGGTHGQRMNSVTVGGPGLVAVGSVGSDGDADAAVWTSVDGIAWSRVAHDEAVFGGTHGQWINSVTVGGPGLVAVGYDDRFSDLVDESTPGELGNRGDEARAAAVWTSVDGLAWSRVPHDEAVFAASNDQGMNSVTAGGPGLVAVGSAGNDGDADAAVWTSVDGITWSRVARDEAVFGGMGNQGMNSVTAGGPGLVAVGVGTGRMTVDEGQVDWQIKAPVWTSVDGITWSRVPDDEGVVNGPGGHEMLSVVAAGPGLVAVGYEQLGDDVPSGRARDAAVWTSIDGATWSRVAHDEAVFGGTGNQMMHSVTVAGAGLIAVGGDGGFYDTLPDAAVWTSVDGVTWSRVAHDEAVFGGADMHSVTVVGAGLIAVGDEWLAAGDSVFVWVAEPHD